MVGHGCSKIVSKTMPLQVAKRGGDHVAVPNRLKMQLFKEWRRSRCVSVRRTVFE